MLAPSCRFTAASVAWLFSASPRSLPASSRAMCRVRALRRSPSSFSTATMTLVRSATSSAADVTFTQEGSPSRLTNTMRVRSPAMAPLVSTGPAAATMPPLAVTEKTRCAVPRDARDRSGEGAGGSTRSAVGSACIAGQHRQALADYLNRWWERRSTASAFDTL